MGTLINAVNFTQFTILEEGFRIGLDWLGELVRLIIEGIGITAVGVIVFTLILKAITLPFDVYQRFHSRKQTLIMREMKPELEKLQKQYANDKQTYNMKMVELQKKNGYSMMGACLPLIISIVILMVAIFAFQSYATYANLSMYEAMAHRYNAAVLEYAADGTDYREETAADEDELTIPYEEGKTWTENGLTYTMFSDGNIHMLRVEADGADKYLFYEYPFNVEKVARAYNIDIDKLYTNGTAETKETIDSYMSGGESAVDLKLACFNYVNKIGADAAAKEFREGGMSPSFLWVRNVWYPDVPFKSPIQDWNSFKDSIGRDVIRADGTTAPIATVISESQYNNLTASLTDERSQPNGYFIMIALSIGLMILSQVIMMKSQKETNQYQTVDGSGQRTQKIMLVVMPIMYAIFGILWSAAFTIYTVVSSFLSILVSLLSNLIIGAIFKKKEEKAFVEKNTRTLPWMKDGGKNDKNKAKTNRKK